MFTITNLTLTHRKDLTVLVDSLSLAVSDGERLALIGEEGNGKSTLLRVLAGDPSVSDYIEVSGSFSCRGRAICRRNCRKTSAKKALTIFSVRRPRFSISRRKTSANWPRSSRCLPTRFTARSAWPIFPAASASNCSWRDC